MTIYDYIVYILTFENYITIENAFYFWSLIIMSFVSISWLFKKIKGVIKKW